MNRRYLKSYDIVQLWRSYQTHLSTAVAAKEFGVSLPAARGWVKEIEHVLAGGRVTRVRGGDELRTAIKTIKVQAEPASTPPSTQEIPTAQVSPVSNTESSEQRIERLWEELKIAIVDYAREVVVMEEAKKSNIVRLIKRGLSS